MNSPRLLLVDDELMFVEMLADALRDHGFSVFTATNAPDALKKASELSPDLILMDGVMPGGTGWDALRELKSDARTQSVPVVMMTGHAIDPANPPGTQMAACLLKPFSPKQLVEMLDRVLREARASE